MKNFLMALAFVQSLASAQIVPFDSPRWKFSSADYNLVQHQGKDALLLKRNRAVLEGVDFENGIIEYDMAFPQVRSFIGMQFRIVDDKNYEEFYVRPHQSGNPDANQYTPVFGGNAAWQLYYGEGYGAPVKYDFNTWIHFKLVILDQHMEVYIQDMDSPVLFAEFKRKPVKGNIAIQNGNNESYFANVSATPNNDVQLKGKPKPTEPVAPGTIEKWLVSPPFSEKLITPIASLTELTLKPEYTSYGIELTGTLNISSTAELSEETNAVLAKIIIDSDKVQLKKLLFGFSDRVKVFVNGNAMFSGEDNFLSRDYRFLGTVGYFDAIYLPLKKGRNEIIFAVSESFGGWGIKAKVENMDGIKIVH